jgi:hypothetical protein
MDFCEIDGSRLTTEYTNSGIIKKCYMCGTMKDSKAEDTLILTEYIKKKKHNNNIEFLKNGKDDHINNCIYKECPKCKFQIVKMVYTGEDLKVNFICDCGNIF